MGAEGAASLAPPSSTTGSQRFRRLFQVGKGGMGVVDVALERGDGSFQRIVALKCVLREGAEDERNREMFFREARLAALLAHPNVVHAFNFGEIDGELFLTMEYVEGEALSRLITAVADRCEGVPVPLAAHILAEMCEGLHAVHELRDVDGTALNVVHRDLSPHNVMVAYTGHVKLLDFGIAKFDTPHQDMTRTGEVKGKVAYMSPEQALGEKVDRRSDLYALGAIMFELLTSHRMWGSGTELEVMRRLALEDPPLLRDALPTAPDPLVRLFGELVSKDRNARPSNAAEVAVRLREIARAAGVGDRETLEQYMLHLFGDRAEERRRILAHALKAPVVETPEPKPPTMASQAPKNRRVAAAAIIVGLASSLAVASALFGARTRQGSLPAQGSEAIDSSHAVVLSPPPATNTVPAVSASADHPSESPTSATSKWAIRPQARPSAPLVNPSASAPQLTSPEPTASVPSKRGSDMPLIPSPVR